MAYCNISGLDCLDVPQHAMSGNDGMANDNKRRFSGLSDLTSDVESVSSKQHDNPAESSSRVKTGINRESDSRQLSGEGNVSSGKLVSPVSGGLFSEIMRLLLAIPWQLYLVGGVAIVFITKTPCKTE